MSEKQKNNARKNSLFQRLFGGKQGKSIFEEEQVQSPSKTVLKNFISNKLSVGAVLILVVMFAAVFIGSSFVTLDLSYAESSQQNVAPGLSLLSVPNALKENGASLSAGSTFSVGADKDGNVYVWGHPDISKTISMEQIPEDMGKVTMVSAGYDHAIAVNENNEVFCWGNDRLKQCAVPTQDIASHGNVVQVLAGYQISVALMEDGYVLYWGNTALNDVMISSEVQGTIAKVALTSDALIGLTFDGEVVYLGGQKTAYSTVPESLKSGVVDIAATGSTCAGLLENGEVVVWGNITKSEGTVPAVDGKIVSLVGGRYHYVGLTDKGSVVAWGDNTFGQLKLPSSVGEGITQVFSGFYQNYALDEDGNVHSWGLKGYVFGTDGLGRDILTRLVHGGKMTMTIGAIAVVISTVIGIIVGCMAGYFGGKVDMFLMRVAEIISAMPFLPFAMILSSIIGNSLSETQRIFLIMVILGVLSWSGLARLVRAQVLSQREQEFVTAAKAMGVKQSAIVFKHILPNVISTIIVNATLSFATCLLTESSLSYLGFGVSLPRPTWGNMLTGSNNSIVIQNYWWQWVFPALALSICVICINTIGDGLRDAIDPKSNER